MLVNQFHREVVFRPQLKRPSALWPESYFSSNTRNPEVKQAKDKTHQMVQKLFKVLEALHLARNPSGSRWSSKMEAI
jgi:hypothetical protein